MAKPAVLVVGAGALGITTGYHLNLAGADVTFLVRTTRLEALQKPLLLYCYDDDQLKEFADFTAVATVAEAVRKSYDFVLVTLDGATCRTDEATQLLNELGSGIRDSSAVAVVSGIGVRAHCRDTMGLADDRVLEGTMGIFSYQVGKVQLPLHPPTDLDKLSRAVVGYRHASGKNGFMVSSKPPKASRDFAELYDKCGVSSCRVTNARLYAVFGASFFPIMAVFDLAGWPDAGTMVGNTELLALGSRAMKETMALPEGGWMGKIASLFITPKLLAKSLVKMEQDCLPMDFSGFNRFHHGGKVLEQDIQVMRQSAASGKAQGKAMPALEEVIRRYEALCTERGSP